MSSESCEFSKIKKGSKNQKKILACGLQNRCSENIEREVSMLEFPFQ